jgi:hypothetical protein
LKATSSTTPALHFMRDVLAHAETQGRHGVSAFIGTAFAKNDGDTARTQWRSVANQIGARVPTLAVRMCSPMPEAQHLPDWRIPGDKLDAQRCRRNGEACPIPGAMKVTCSNAIRRERRGLVVSNSSHAAGDHHPPHMRRSEGRTTCTVVPWPSRLSIVSTPP